MAHRALHSRFLSGHAGAQRSREPDSWAPFQPSNAAILCRPQANSESKARIRLAELAANPPVYDPDDVPFCIVHNSPVLKQNAGSDNPTCQALKSDQLHTTRSLRED